MMHGHRIPALISVSVLTILALLLLFLPTALAQDSPAPGPSRVVTREVSKIVKPPAEFHEDLASISLATSHLVPEKPVMGFKDDRPDFTREIWQVAWRPADPLDLYIIRPKKVAKPPVVLFLYSFPTNTNRFKDERWCLGATNGGYAAVGFVSALTGDRINYQPLNQWFVSQLQKSLVTTTHDVQMILNFLAARGDLDMDHVGMFGEGSGGTIAILAASADPRIKAIQVLAPWGDWPDWLAKSTVVPDDQRAKFLKPDFLASVAPLDPIQLLPKMKSQAVRIQDLPFFPLVPVKCQKSIEAVAPDTAEIDQFGDGRAVIRAIMLTGKPFGWLKDQLEPNAKPVAPLKESERIHYYPPGGGAATVPGTPASPPQTHQPQTHQ